MAASPKDGEAQRERQRVMALRRLQLLDTPPAEGFDRLVRLASRMVGVPVALVSLVDEDRQFFKSQVGLADPIALKRETPLSHSFCQHVVASQMPLVVNDSRLHPLVADNGAVRDLNVIAYAGIPLTTADGHTLGSFCAIDVEPRVWTADELGILTELAAAAVSEVELHAAHLALQENATHLEVLVEERTRELRIAAAENRAMGLAALRALASAVDAKDVTTREHSERVSSLGEQLALTLGWSEADAARLADAGLVHDVGKIAVPDAILFKPGPLDDDEYVIVKQHAALGARICAGILDQEQIGWVRHHHERPDRRGYPDGLGRPDIPEGALLLAVADSYDVMTVARPYHAPVSAEAALAECRRCAESQFDSRVVQALERVVSGREVREAA